MNTNIRDTDFNICVGVITSAFGIKGYVRICSLVEDPNDFSNFQNVFDVKGKNYSIKIISSSKNKLIASIQDINSRTEAEALCNTQLFIKRSDLPEIIQDQFYHADLYSMIARLKTGEELGIIKNVFNFGASDILEICDFASERIMYYPFVKNFVLEVNLAEKYVVLESLEEVVG